jgi:NAD(P)-dependent dehydrogenase (short-subunit alcohol dehydrogenase family)
VNSNAGSKQELVDKKSFQDKDAIITGAGSCIGRSLAFSLNQAIANWHYVTCISMASQKRGLCMRAILLQPVSNT